MKIVECLEESGLLVEHVSETIKNEAKEQKGNFSACTVSANLLGNLLTGKGVKAKILERRVMTAGKQTIRAGQNF